MLRAEELQSQPKVKLANTKDIHSALGIAEEKVSPTRSVSASSSTLCGSISEASGETDTCIWIGYMRNGIYLIDKRALSGSTEERLRGLRRWWECQVPKTYMAEGVILCKRPVVLIGHLAPVRKIT